MLEDVGRSIQNAFKQLTTTPTDAQIDTALKDICNSLLHANVPPKTILTLRSEVLQKIQEIPRGVSKARAVQQCIEECLINLLNPQTEPYHPKKGERNIIMFVGIQGSGKTTTLCKYASLHAQLGFKVAVVCADTFRPGALAQVRTHCLRLKIPFYGSDSADPVLTASKGVAKFQGLFDLILVDTSGRAFTDNDLFEEMRQIHSAINPKTILIMDAGIGQSAETQALAFSKAVEINAIILTKLDATKRGGGALSSVAATKTPIAFIGHGETLNDLRKFDAKRFVSMLLGKGDLSTLTEKMQQLNIDETAFMEKAGKGNLTLRDFYEQFVQLSKLGPLSSLTSLLPGGIKMDEMDDVFPKMICVFDSLSKNELNSDGSMFENNASRVLRVAKGSGTNAQTVRAMLTQFKNMSMMIKKLAKMPGFCDIVGKDPNNLSLTEKTRVKGQMKGLLPKGLYEQMSQFFQ